MLQVWNVNPYVGIVGVFNLQGSAWDRVRRKFHIHSTRGVRLSTRVCPADVEPFRPDAPAAAAAAAAAHQQQQQQLDGAGSRWAGAAAAAGVADTNNSSGTPQQQQQQQLFVVYRYGTELLQVCSATEGVGVELDKAGSDLVWISPLQQAGGVAFAPLGLAEMFNGGGAVQACSLTAAAKQQQQQQQGDATAAAGGGRGGPPSVVAALQLRGCGRFMAFSSARPRAVLLNLTPHNFSWDEFNQRLEFEVPEHVPDLRCEVQVLYE
jgi:raffinose synthase